MIRKHSSFPIVAVMAMATACVAISTSAHAGPLGGGLHGGGLGGLGGGLGSGLGGSGSLSHGGSLGNAANNVTGNVTGNAAGNVMAGVMGSGYPGANDTRSPDRATTVPMRRIADSVS